MIEVFLNANTPVPLWTTALTACGGGVATFFLTSIFMSKKDRRDFEQKKYDNSIKIRDEHAQYYREYIEALKLHAAENTQDTFITLCRCGDSYFNQVARMCDTILSGKADEGMRDRTWLPLVKDVIERSLPNHYVMLASEAKRLELPYSGKLRRRDHESIYAVAEKYSTAPAWLRSHEDD